MELRHLKAFLHVANRMSFYKAAQSLNYAQSTVSAQIRALEEELGVRLFDRLGRRIKLTEPGRRLLPHAGRLLNLAEEARAEVASGSESFGSLNIMIPESLLTHSLPPLLSRFMNEYPGLRLNFRTCTFHGLEQELKKGLADLAFLLADGVSGSNLAVEFLGSLRLVLVAGPGHELSSKAHIQTGDLAGQTLLLSTSDCSYRRGFEDLLSEKKVYPGAVMEFSSVAALKKAVEAGLGLSLLPETAAAQEAGQGSLVVLDWAGEEMETGLLMVRHKDKWLSPSLRAFMETARVGMVPGFDRGRGPERP